jgi:FKBP-type peptidyl-prolyl cis-trans isomerase SlyD
LSPQLTGKFTQLITILMEINNNKVVELIYTLIVDGKEADKTTEEKPLDFIFGTGTLLPKFEENILSKNPGDPFEFILSAEEGYGMPNTEMVVELPKSVFEVDGQLREDLLFVGNIIPMMNNMGGVMHGKVAEVKDEFIIMDFNHPMSGKELHFSGKILNVREATEEELTNGLHGEKKAQECSGSCSSCGGCH